MLTHYYTSLIKYCCDGCRKSQSDFFNTYYKTGFWICYRYFEYYDDIQEAVQMGFIQLFKEFQKKDSWLLSHEWEDDRHFINWIKLTFKRSSIEVWRRKKARKTDSPDAFEYTASSNYADALSIVGEKEILIKMEGLPPYYKAILHMYCIQGFTIKEISKQLRVDRNTISGAFLIAQSLLKSKIEISGRNESKDRRQEKSVCYADYRRLLHQQELERAKQLNNQF